MTLRIRAALQADAAPLLCLIHAHAAFEEAVATIDEEALAALLADSLPPSLLIVAEHGASLVGYAALTFDYGLWAAVPYAHLDCLFVAEPARGQGFGKGLFDHACQLATQRGAQRIEWQTPASNAGAIAFYQREGGTGRPKMRFSKLLSD